jgi:lipoprotein-releasing system permease protein
MIVRDKTRDIGIIKAVGGSEEGVAMIFLAYGLFIGIVGGVLGMISGVEFVLHTNEIHEFIYRMTGRMIWDRSVYMFDEIPHTVNPHEVAWYFVAALIAGVIGALIPAIVAGSEDPVKAVRYE